MNVGTRTGAASDHKALAEPIDKVSGSYRWTIATLPAALLAEPLGSARVEVELRTSVVDISCNSRECGKIRGPLVCAVTPYLGGACS
jgi:hypothetical protein